MAKWYVAQIWSGMQRPEKHTNIPKIEYDLQKLGIEHFNPTELKRYIHHRTKRPIHRREALVPGYVFVTGNFQWPDLMNLNGVMNVIGFQGEPYVIPDRSIEQLRLAEAFAFDEFIKEDIRSRGGKTSGFTKDRLAQIFPKGSLVRIHSDIWGTKQSVKVLGATGRETIKVLVEMLGAMVPVEIGVENVEKVA